MNETKLSFQVWEQPISSSCVPHNLSNHLQVTPAPLQQTLSIGSQNAKVWKGKSLVPCMSSPFSSLKNFLKTSYLVLIKSQQGKCLAWHNPWDKKKRIGEVTRSGQDWSPLSPLLSQSEHRGFLPHTGLLRPGVRGREIIISATLLLLLISAVNCHRLRSWYAAQFLPMRRNWRKIRNHSH